MNDSHFLSLAWTQLVQVSLLIAVVWLLVKLFARQRPHLAYALWLLVLVKCLTPPVMSSPTGMIARLTIQKPDWLTLESPVDVKEEAPAPVPADLAPELPAEDPLPEFQVAEANFEIDDLSRGFVIDEDELPPEFFLEEETEFLAADEPPAVVPELPEEPAADIPVSSILWKLWFSSAGVVLLITFSRVLITLRRVCRNRVDTPEELTELVAQLSRKLKLRRKVSVLVTAARVGPAVVGFFRPLLILPQVVTGGRSVRELEPIIAHELLHVKRGDLGVGWLQVLVQSLWWFHPLVWLVNRFLSREAERCCDEAVVAELECPPATYARCLLNVLEQKRNLTPIPACPGVKPVELTKQRMERIMKLGQGCRKRSPWWCWLVVVLLGVVVLPGRCASVAKAAKPQFNFRVAEGNLVEIKTRKIKPGQQLKSEARLVTRTYDIQEAIEQFQSEFRLDREEARIALEHLVRSTISTYDSAMGPTNSESTRIKCVADSSSLSVTGPQEALQHVESLLKTWRDVGLVQVTFEVLILESPIEFSADHVTGWTQKSSALTARLSEEDRSKLLQFVQHVPRSSVMTRPQVTLFNCQRAGIQMEVQRPFVTGMKGETPQIEVIAEGIQLTLAPTVDRDDNINLDLQFQMSEIGDVSTKELKRTAGQKPATIQVPQVRQTVLSCSSTINEGETLLIGGLKKKFDSDPENQVFMLIRPKLKKLDWKEFIGYLPALNDEERKEYVHHFRFAANRLDRAATARYLQFPLSQVLLEIQQQTGLPVILDRAQREQAGISPDPNIDLQLSGVSWQTILKSVLEPNGLGFCLVPVYDTEKKQYQPTIVVTSQDELVDLSLALRARSIPLICTPDDYEYSKVTPTKQKILKALEEPFKLEFEGTLLTAAFLQIADETGISVYVDGASLHLEGVNASTRINFQSDASTPLRQALTDICKPLGLTFHVEDEVLKITSKEHYQNEIVTVGYQLKQIAPGQKTSQAVIDHIRQTFAPESWENTREFKIVPSDDGQTVYIRQRRKVHQQMQVLAAPQRSEGSDTSDNRVAGWAWPVDDEINQLMRLKYKPSVRSVKIETEDGTFSFPSELPPVLEKVRVRIAGPEKTQYSLFKGMSVDLQKQPLPVRETLSPGGKYLFFLDSIAGRQVKIEKPLPRSVDRPYRWILEIPELSEQMEAYFEDHELPIEITDADLDNVDDNLELMKVFYIERTKQDDQPPAPVQWIVNSRLEPDLDPVVEAQKRGTILAVLRSKGPTAVGVPAEHPPLEIRPPQKENQLQGATGDDDDSGFLVIDERNFDITPEPISEKHNRPRNTVELEITVSFDKTPLKSAVEQICEAGDLQVEFDEDELAEEGVALDAPVSYSVRNEVALQALSEMLKPLKLELDLTPEPVDQHGDQGVQIRIRPSAVLERISVTVKYPIGDLLEKDKFLQAGPTKGVPILNKIPNQEKLFKAQPRTKYDAAEALIGIIEKSLAWGYADKPSGTIVFHEPTESFVIHCNRSQHELIAKLLCERRTACGIEIKPSTSEKAERTEADMIHQVDPELWQILVQWEQASSRYKRLSGEFRMFSYESDLELEQRSQGQFCYEAPDQWRVDLHRIEIPPSQRSLRLNQQGQPYSLKSAPTEIRIRNGNLIAAAQEEPRKAYSLIRIPERIRQGSFVDGVTKFRRFGPASEFLCGLSAQEAINRYHFTLIPQTDEQSVWFDVLPKRAFDKQLFKRSQVILDRKTLLPEAVKLIDPEGTTEIVYRFGYIKVNGKADEGLFDIPEVLRGYKGVLLNAEELRELGAAQDRNDNLQRDERTSLSPPEDPNPGITTRQFPNPVAADQIDTVQVQFQAPEDFHLHIRETVLNGPENHWQFQLPEHPNLTPGTRYHLVLYKQRVDQKQAEVPPAKLFEWTLELSEWDDRTKAYLSQHAIPLAFTDEDLDQVSAHNSLTKVVYVEKRGSDSAPRIDVRTLSSTRLDPGIDPIAEGKRRGTILAVLRSLPTRKQAATDVTGATENEIVEHSESNAEPPVPAKPKQAETGSETPFITKVYPVAELVVPIPGVDTSNTQPPAVGGPGPGVLPAAEDPLSIHKSSFRISQTQFGAPRAGTPIRLPGQPHLMLGQPDEAKTANAPGSPGITAYPVLPESSRYQFFVGFERASSPKPNRPTCDASALIELIFQTLKSAHNQKLPEGTKINFVEDQLSLVVRAESKDHEIIAELLADLRREQDLQVTLECLTVHFEKDSFADFWTNVGIVCENSDSARQNSTDPLILHGVVQDDFRAKVTKFERAEILGLPKLTVFNGVGAQLQISSAADDQKSGRNMHYMIVPTITRDRSSVDVKFAVNPKNTLDVLSKAKSMTIPDAKSVLIEVTDELLSELKQTGVPEVDRALRELKKKELGVRTFVLLTPRIIIQEEEEELLGLPAATPQENQSNHSESQDKPGVLFTVEPRIIIEEEEDEQVLEIPIRND